MNTRVVLPLLALLLGSWILCVEPNDEHGSPSRHLRTSDANVTDNNNGNGRSSHEKKCSVIYFFHIQKTGGSSIRSAMHMAAKINPRARMYEWWVNSKSVDNLNHAGIAKLNATADGEVRSQISELRPGDVLFIHHHHGAPGLADAWPLIEGWRDLASTKECTFYTFTFLRDPVQRMISTYFYEHLKNVPVPKFIKEMARDNYHVRYVLNSHKMPQHYKISSQGVGLEHVEIALAALQKLDVITDTACEAAIVKQISNLSGISFPSVYTNKTPPSDKRQLSDKELAIFKAANAWDEYLYSEVRNLYNFQACS